MEKVNPEEMQLTAVLDSGNYATTINHGDHEIKSYEPIDRGGLNKGLTPKQLLASSLASCTTITLKMYADRKGWKIDRISIHINYLTAYDKENPHLTSTIKIDGELDNKEMDRMMVIAQKCPVHKLLSRSISIHTTLI